MRYVVLLIVLAIPLAEIAVFIRVADGIGLGPTLALVILAGVVGIALVRRQGLGAVRRAEARLRANEPPVAEFFDGICLFVAGILLMLPGFLSDIAGAVLLIPAVRRALLRLVAGRFAAAGSYASFGWSGAPRPADDTVIDIDYEDVTVRDDPRLPKP